MTQAEYDAYQARRKASGPKPEQVVCHESVAEKERETSHPESIPRRVVRITSYRRRLLDFDNLAGGCKYFLDSCKYAGLIPDDGPECITLEVSQVRVKTKAEERTELEIIKL
jgi:hypothetical protein